MAKRRKNKKGFSIGETLLSMFLLVIGIAVTFEVIGSSLIHTSDSRKTAIASGLAQEALELTRNIRDNNLLNAAAWRKYDQGLPSGFGKCIDIEIDTLNWVSNNELSCTDHELFLNNGGYYVHNNSGDTTGFYRKVDIITVANPRRGKEVRVTVRWDGNSFPSPSNCNANTDCVFVKHFLAEDR